MIYDTSKALSRRIDYSKDDKNLALAFNKE